MGRLLRAHNRPGTTISRRDGMGGEPECPWEAIFEGEAVPDVFKDDIALNARTVERPDDFAVPEVVERPVPPRAGAGKQAKVETQRLTFSNRSSVISVSHSRTNQSSVRNPFAV